MKENSRRFISFQLNYVFISENCLVEVQVLKHDHGSTHQERVPFINLHPVNLSLNCVDFVVEIMRKDIIFTLLLISSCGFNNGEETNFKREC